MTSPLLLTYALFIYKRILNPFMQLQSFAKQIASGNLDIPLAMDTNQLFDAFTESFDIMRQAQNAVQEADYYERVRLHTIPDSQLFVDPLRLAQVIGNIISNAYKYGSLSLKWIVTSPSTDCFLLYYYIMNSLKL